MAGTNDGHFVYQGKLTGHGGWVTSIATPLDSNNSIISSSRDKTVLVWDVSSQGRDRARQVVNEDAYGLPLRRLAGHADFVQDVALSSDGQFALSGSLDTTLRLWDLSQGRTVHSFASHTKDVLSVAFSPDNRQIVSGGRDHVLKVWNALGECKYTINEGAHTDWVSCVRFSPNQQAAHIVSGGWDKKVKIWSLRDFKLHQDLIGHTGYVSTVTISPDGSLCASGGRDGIAFLWDLNRGEKLYALGDADEPIHSLTFSPNRYWLCAATDKKIKIWDLESKQQLATLVPSKDSADGAPGPRTSPECVSLAWSNDGSTLYSGYTDNTIRVWGVSTQTA